MTDTIHKGSNEPINRRMVLKHRPDGLPKESDFELEESPLLPLGEDQVTVEVSHLSVDAFIRTDDRSPFSYLVRPLSGYFDKAFRES